VDTERIGDVVGLKRIKYRCVCGTAVSDPAQRSGQRSFSVILHSASSARIESKCSAREGVGKKTLEIKGFWTSLDCHRSILGAGDGNRTHGEGASGTGKQAVSCECWCQVWL